MRVKLPNIIKRFRSKVSDIVFFNALIELNTHRISSCSTLTILTVEMEERRKVENY